MSAGSAASVSSNEDLTSALRQVTLPVSIITTRAGKVLEGITATAVNFVAPEPPTLLVCLGRDTAVDQLIARSRVFAVSFLSQEQYRLAHRFTATGKDPKERFGEGKWISVVTGSPLLKGCVAGFDCELDNTVGIGNRNVRFGKIVGVTGAERDALLHRDGLLRRLMPLD